MKNVHSDEKLGYSGHGTKRSDISCDDDDYERRNISVDDGDKRVDISVNFGNHFFSYYRNNNGISDEKVLQCLQVMEDVEICLLR